MSESKEMVIGNSDQLLSMTTRRRFLGLLGVAGSIVLLPSVFTACGERSSTDPSLDPDRYRLDLTTDLGILNYAYALEQLEAAYYTAAIGTVGFTQLSTPEQEVINDLQKHEVIHREFLKQVLGTDAIPTIAFNASTLATLTESRDALLRNAQLLEDTGVSAYNGAGKYLASAANLLVAGKIVSVEARHAAAIRDIRDTTGLLFAGDNVVNAQGLDVKAEPRTVVDAVVKLNVAVSPLDVGTDPTRTPATPDQPAPAPA